MQPLIISRGSVTSNQARRSVSPCPDDQFVHPRRDHHVHGHSVRAGHKQEIASLSNLEIADLPLRQIECSLELYGLRVLLAAQQKDAGVRGENCAILGFKEGPRILADQDQTAAILSNATRETN